MRTEFEKLKVMLDEGAPRASADPFRVRGHGIIFHQSVLSPGAKDPFVAYTAITNHAVLIATDRDMKQMAKRFGSPCDGGKFGKLHLIFINCNEVLACKRIEHAMSFIESEWKFTCAKTSRRLWLDIGPHHLRTHR